MADWRGSRERSSVRVWNMVEMLEERLCGMRPAADASSDSNRKARG